MKRPILRATLAVAVGVVLCAAPERARASGFHIDEQDARATGRAGAVTANPENASAIYYNPAGIATLRGVQIQLGASLIVPSAEFTPARGGAATAAKDETFVLPQAYVTGRVSDLLALGLGFNSPFGLALDWPATSPGRASVRQAELRTFFITPAFGLELSEWVPGLSFGAGLDLVPASVRLTRDVPFGIDVGSVALSGTAFGVGGRAGILYRPPALEKWSFGLNYRSPVALDFEGDADFDAAAPYRASLPPDGPVATSVTLPQMLVLGVMFEPIRAWEVEVDGTWRGWSSYDRLDIELPGGQVTSSRKDWEDSFTVRVGTQYSFAERWAARLGFIWDQTPIPASTLDFQLPDADRIDVSAGIGASISKNLRVDLGALYVLPQERSTSNADPAEPPVKGRFAIDAWVFGLSVGIQFDTAEPDTYAYPTAAAPGGSAPLTSLDPAGPTRASPPWSAQPALAPRPQPEPREAGCRRGPRARALTHALPSCRE